MNTQDAATYQSYLLRLWRDHPEAVWRASLQSTVTEELRHFATVEELWVFLMVQMEVGNGDQEADALNSTTNTGSTGTHGVDQSSGKVSGANWVDENDLPGRFCLSSPGDPDEPEH